MFGNYRQLVMMILLGLLWAAPAHAESPTPDAATVSSPISIREGSVVSVILKQTLQSGTSSTGSPVRFEVAGEVRSADGRELLIPAGTPALGVVTASLRARRFGRPGMLCFTCDYVLLSDGTRVPLRSPEAMTVRGRTNMLGAMGIGMLLLAPAATTLNIGSQAAGNNAAVSTVMAGATVAGIGSMWRGRNVSVEAGRTFKAVVARDTPIPMFAPAVPDPCESAGSEGR